jgi:hypothetical protein
MALALIDELMSELTRRQFESRAAGFAQMKDWIARMSSVGVCARWEDSFPKPRLPDGVRADIEVRAGQCPVPLSQKPNPADASPVFRDFLVIGQPRPAQVQRISRLAPPNISAVAPISAGRAVFNSVQAWTLDLNAPTVEPALRYLRM